jgi:hypothetical protein
MATCHVTLNHMHTHIHASKHPYMHAYMHTYMLAQLGCGVGLPGLYAARGGCITHFQDYVRVCGTICCPGAFFCSF